MELRILEELFDSTLKIRLFKLFLRNPGKDFSFSEISQRIKSNSRSLQTQLDKFVKIKFLNAKTSAKSSSKRGKHSSKRKVFSANPNFIFYEELRNLVLKSSATSEEEMKNKLKKLGKIQLALLAGLFINSENSRVDLFIVGDGIKKRRLTYFIKDLETEVGKEITYTIMTAEEFTYRYNMFDKFIRDILETSHKMIINKLRI